MQNYSDALKVAKHNNMKHVLIRIIFKGDTHTVLKLGDFYRLHSLLILGTYKSSGSNAK